MAEVDGLGNLILASTNAGRHLLTSTEVDPVLLEVMSNLFMSVADQMGATLANTSQSVNIKERFDFSCAIFDATGDLVANAPHVPVHLGSMSDSIKTVMRGWPDVADGDAMSQSSRQCSLMARRAFGWGRAGTTRTSVGAHRGRRHPTASTSTKRAF
jgi:5-oxoprolinase (ATP-hydrolysing)